MRGGKHVKVKKQRRQDILILGSIGTPLTTSVLREYCTSYQKLECFVLYRVYQKEANSLKNYS